MSTYNLFISHSWAYDETYQGLVNILNNQVVPGIFTYKNYSVPKNDPIHNAPTVTALRAAIDQQIKSSSCVLILAGVYSTYSKWINIEIEIARKYGKKIIAIEPWGAERTSSTVKNAANYIVKWNGASIVKAIKA